MKYAIATLAFLMAAIGCRAQVPPNPTVFVCQPSTGSAYTPLNAPNGSLSLSQSDTPAAAGQYCYIAEAVIASTGQVSIPSNIIGPFNITTLTGAKTVNITITPASSGPAPTGYVISRALAMASTLNAPALGNGSLAQNQEQPAAKTLAMGPSINLSGEVR